MMLNIIRKPANFGKFWTIENIDNCRIIYSAGEYGVFVNDRLELRCEYWGDVVKFCQSFFAHRIANTK